MGRVFVSYSHENAAIVGKVNDYLSSNNILTWFDRDDIKESDYWDSHIRTALYCSNVFLLFLSKEYLASLYCRKELGIANAMPECKIVVVGLDSVCDSFSLDSATESIQRVAYDYKKHSVDDLCRILLQNEHIKQCHVCPEIIGVKGTKPTAFLSGIVNFYNAHPKHHDMLLLYLSFVEYIKTMESKGRFISAEANFKTLDFYEVDSHSLLRYVLRLDESNGFCATPDRIVRNNYLKRVLFVLFNYSYINYNDALQPDMVFNRIFSDEIFEENPLKKRLYDVINKHISAAYKNITELNAHLQELYKVLNAVYYLEHCFSIGSSERVYRYEINDLIIELSRQLVIAANKIEDRAVDGALAKIFCEETATTYSLETLQTNVDGNLFLYGNIGCGKTTQFIKAFFQNKSGLYIDLSLAYRRFDNDYIKNSLSKLETGYLLDYNELYNYSSYVNRITLFVDNLDRLPEDSRKKVINEFEGLSAAFRLIIFSSKRNIEGKISLDEKDSTFQNYRYCEILPLDKHNILCYLKGAGINDGILASMANLEDTHAFFAFFNNFTKLNVLLESIRNSVDFDLSKIDDTRSAEIEIYRTIFEGEKDYSVSKRISKEFINTIVPIDDVIVKLVLDEIEELKEISYSKKYERIKKMRFRDLNCSYSILSKENDSYQFLNEDIESYFVASFVIRKLKESALAHGEMQDLLLPLIDDYNVLKYLSQMNIAEYISLEELFATDKHELVPLKLVMFKICQYTNSSRQQYKKLSTIEEIPDNFFFNAENIKVVSIPNSVRLIGRASFSNMTRLETLYLTSTTSELVIKPWSILNCQNLKTIVLGSNYLQYNSPLFSKCTALQEIRIRPGNPAFSVIDKQILASRDGKILYTSVNSLHGEVVIPDGVEVLAENALANLDKVTVLRLPAGITEIDTSFCDFCDRLQAIHINSPVYFSDTNGIVFTRQGGKKVLFRVPSGYEKDLYLADDVQIIGSDSISCCSKIKHIVIPSSVTRVENYAFADTLGLEKLTFMDINAIDYFGNYVLLTTNDYATIDVYYDDCDDEVDRYSVAEFNKKFTKKDNNNYVIPLHGNSVTTQLFVSHGFEVIASIDSDRSYNNGVILRAINLFEDVKCSAADYNILLIGMTEYKTINSKPVCQMKQYIEDLINKKFISMVVYTRDLPMIRQLYDYTDRVSIIRTSKGSTFATNKIQQILANKGN